MLDAHAPALEGLLSAGLILLALALAAPSLVLAVECVVGALSSARCRLPVRPGVRTAVLVPAHDEEAVLGATLRALRPELGPRDRLVVVADNCTDRTAEVAEAEGAEVVERHDPERRGKGWALAFGVRALAADPPDVVVVVDADCRVSPGAVARLAGHAAATRRPVQADYVHAPSDATARSAVSGFAFLLKNRVRPRGLAALGLPSQLTGSGEAFPWALVAGADAGALGEGALAEDYRAGLELGLRGAPPLPCVCTRCTSALPDRAPAAATQRRRWEHGHLAVLLQHAPRLLRAGVARGRTDMVAQALDLLVPPVTFLALLQALALALGVVAAAAGLSSWPLALALSSSYLAGLGVSAAWWRFGRDVLPPRRLVAVPAYVAWKVPMYAAYLLGRGETRYGRTPRPVALLEPAAPAPQRFRDRIDADLEPALQLDAQLLTPAQRAWLDAQAKTSADRAAVIGRLIDQAMTACD